MVQPANGPAMQPLDDTVRDLFYASGDVGRDLLFLERNGYVEETYHTFSYSPLTDDDARIVGMLCVVSEITDQVIGERRMSNLIELGSELTKTNIEAHVVAAVEERLGAERRSFPFTLMYLFFYDGTGAG